MIHTAPDAPFVFHHRLIGKGAMKKFGIDSQWRNENFYRHLSSLNMKKTMMNDTRLLKLREERLNAIG
jgi:hypothetical protein